MYKNVASQKLRVFAWDATTGLPKTGDASNITAYVNIDFGGVTVLGDTSATEESSSNAPGFYDFDLTQAETNGNALGFSAKSSTSNIVVVGVPAMVFTTPNHFSDTVISSGGTVNSDAKAINAVATTSVTTVNANVGTTQPLNFTGAAGSALVKTDMIDAASVAVTLDANNALNVSAKYWAGTAITATSIPVATAAGAAGGLFIAGSNAATTTASLTTGAIAATTITASGAVAFQSTFAVTGTTTLTGAVSLGSTLGVTGTTTLAALNTGAIGTGNVTITGTLSTSGTTTFNALTVTNALTVSGTSTFTGAVSLGSTLGVTGTVTFNAFTVTNAFTVSGATTHTGAFTATNASNDIRGIQVASLSAAGVTAIENTVWDTVLASHVTPGTTGAALSAAGGSGDPWITPLPGAYAAGTAGHIIGTALPDIAPGSANGLLRGGTNTATTFATLTSTGAFTISGVSNISQTGDAFARIGATGSGLTSLAQASVWTSGLATSLTTLASHDPGATIGTSTLTQSQVTGGAYDVQSASCVLGDARIANLNATISSRMATYTQPTGFLAATFPTTVASTTNITAGTITTATNVTTVNGLAAGVITDTALATSGANRIADTVRRRTQANVEASSYGDTLSVLSLYGFIQQAQESDTTTTPGSLTVFQTDGTTVLGARTIATDAASDPIVGIS